MYAVGRLGSYITRGVYTVSAPFHPFGGAVDIIVVEQQDGSFKSSPWYVRFGKFQGVLKTKEKIVNINVNGVDADFHMFLDHTGEAFFLSKEDGDDERDSRFSLQFESGDAQAAEIARLAKCQSLQFESGHVTPVHEIDGANGKIVSRRTSRRSRIFGLMFGQKSMKEDSRQRKGETTNRISSLERAEIAADLLEVKWSSNVSADSRMQEAVLELPASELQAQMAAKNAADIIEADPRSLHYYVKQRVPDDDERDGNSSLRHATSPHDDVRDECSSSIQSASPHYVIRDRNSSPSQATSLHDDLGYESSSLNLSASPHGDAEYESSLNLSASPHEDVRYENSSLYNFSCPHEGPRYENSSLNESSSPRENIGDENIGLYQVASPAHHSVRDDNSCSFISVTECTSEINDQNRSGHVIHDKVVCVSKLSTDSVDGGVVKVEQLTDETVDTFDVTKRQPTTQSMVLNLHGHDLLNLEDDCNANSEVSDCALVQLEPVSDNGVGHLATYRQERNGEKCFLMGEKETGVSSCTFGEMPVSSSIVVGPSEQEPEVPDFTAQISDEVYSNTLVLRKITKLVPEMDSSIAALVKEGRSEGGRGSCDSRQPGTHDEGTLVESKGTCESYLVSESERTPDKCRDSGESHILGAHGEVTANEGGASCESHHPRTDDEGNSDDGMGVCGHHHPLADHKGSLFEGKDLCESHLSGTEHESTLDEGRSSFDSYHPGTGHELTLDEDRSSFELNHPRADHELPLDEGRSSFESYQPGADHERNMDECRSSYESCRPGADHESEGTLCNSTPKEIVSCVADGEQPAPASLSSRTMILSSSDSIETGMVEAIQSDIEGGTSENISVIKRVEIFGCKSQLASSSSSHQFSGNTRFNRKVLTANDSSSQMPEIYQKVDKNEDSESQTTCAFPYHSNSMYHVRGGEGDCKAGEMREIEVPSKIITGAPENTASSLPEKGVNSSSLPESLKEDQVLFGDINNLIATAVRGDKSISEYAETDSHHMEGTDEEPMPNDTNHESPWSSKSSRSVGFRSFSTVASYSSELVPESSPNAFEGSPIESRAQSNPISIPESSLHSKGLGEIVGSAPSIRGHIHDLERSDVHEPFSHSLDSSSGNFEWSLQRKEVINAIKVHGSSEDNLDRQQPMAEGTTRVDDPRSSGEHACGSIKHTVAASGALGVVAFVQEQIVQSESMIPADKIENANKEDLSRAMVRSSGSWRIWPFSFGKTKTSSSIHSVSDDTIESDASSICESVKSTAEDDKISKDDAINKDDERNKDDKNSFPNSAKKHGMRSLVPTSEQLASLKLKEGQNVITFTFSTSMLGKQQVDARIYLWKWNTRVVISDVDGTITKSDVLGQFMPLVGKDWSQSGVAHLFSSIKENGYQLLFLSARSISQAYLTRQFLFNLKQDGKVLPDGPVVISPDGLFPSLFREVIRRAPHEFKIQCLEDIRVLFPPDCNPYYAGFGNRDTDEISYLKVGIPKGKIFIINPKGEVAVNRRVDTRSYTSLHGIVNNIFPPMYSSVEQEDFNTWNYWKVPLPDID